MISKLSDLIPPDKNIFSMPSRPFCFFGGSTIMKKRHGLSTDYDAAQHWRGLAHAHECIMKKFLSSTESAQNHHAKKFIFLHFLLTEKKK